MAQSRSKMTCPRCGVEMNHHADKIVYASEKPMSEADTSMGGWIEEFHTCPSCGGVDSRAA